MKILNDFFSDDHEDKGTDSNKLSIQICVI